MNALNRHVIIAGSAVASLAPAVEVLRRHGVVVSHGAAEAQREARPATILLLAENFSDEMSWDAWWDRDEQNWGAFEAALPRLASTSTGLLLGFGDSSDRRARSHVRKGMTKLLTHFHTHAATDRAVDFTMNGIEIPPTYDGDLLTQRLHEHVARQTSLANETVLRAEALARQTIAEALTADVI